MNYMAINKDSTRLSKRQRRMLKQNGLMEETKPKRFKPNTIKPLTENQKKVFEQFNQGKNLLLHGLAGTGKTFVSMYLALEELFESEDYNKVVLIRSVVPTRDMGFLPGNAKEKSKMYELPYYNICNELFGRGDAYEILKMKQIIEFQTTSFIRGTTYNDCILIVDEMSNMTFHELDSVITRVGQNCRIIFCGDFRQSDLLKTQEKRGLIDFMRIVQRLDNFAHCEFTEDDIVRSGLVKEYIIAKDRLGFGF
jgi:phosphate starvation-inducible PhoH-like protein